MLQTVILHSGHRISSEKCKGNCSLWWSQPVQLQSCLLGTRDHQHISLEMRQSLPYSKARTGPMSRKQCCCSVLEWFFFLFSLKINQSCQRALTLHRQTIFHNSLLLLNPLGKCPTVLMGSHPLPSGEMMKPRAGMSARRARLRHAGDWAVPAQGLQGGPCVQSGTGDVVTQPQSSSSSLSSLILLPNCISWLNKDFPDSSLSILWPECGSKMINGTAWGETQKAERACNCSNSNLPQFPSSVKAGWSQTATKHYKHELINSHSFSNETSRLLN